MRKSLVILLIFLMIPILAGFSSAQKPTINEELIGTMTISSSSNLKMLMLKERIITPDMDIRFSAERLPRVSVIPKDTRLHILALKEKIMTPSTGETIIEEQTPAGSSIKLKSMYKIIEIK